MARHTQFKKILPQKNCTQKRRTIQKHGKYTIYSMQSYYDHMSKTNYKEEISHNHYPNYWKEKKFMKSNQSSNIDDEVEDTNTISNGKIIPLQKQCGKMNQRFPTMETCCNNIKYAIKFDVSDHPS